MNFSSRLSEAREKLNVLVGRLKFEQSKLRRITDTIKDISASAVECAFGRTAASCIGIIGGLLTEQARHESNVSRIMQNINNQEFLVEQLESNKKHAEDLVRNLSNRFDGLRCASLGFRLLS